MLGAFFQRVRALRARLGGGGFLGGRFADGHGFAHAGQLDRLFGGLFRKRHDGLVNRGGHGGRFRCGWLGLLAERREQGGEEPFLAASVRRRGCCRPWKGPGAALPVPGIPEGWGYPARCAANFWAQSPAAWVWVRGCAARILEAARNRREAQGQDAQILARDRLFEEMGTPGPAQGVDLFVAAGQRKDGGQREIVLAFKMRMEATASAMLSSGMSSSKMIRAPGVRR